MAKDRGAPELSPTELGLIKVLWRRGRSSAREVHESLPEELGWAYSTTRTVLERMVTKGAVEKGEFHGLNLYSAAVEKVPTLAGLVREFAQRVLELDTVPVAALLGGSGVLDEAELAELEALLESEGSEEEGR